MFTHCLDKAYTQVKKKWNMDPFIIITIIVIIADNVPIPDISYKKVQVYFSHILIFVISSKIRQVLQHQSCFPNKNL